MKVLIILAHPEPQSMNGAMFTTAIETLEAARHEVRTSNLYAMCFNPVSDHNNFTRLQHSINSNWKNCMLPQQAALPPTLKVSSKRWNGAIS